MLSVLTSAFVVPLSGGYLIRPSYYVVEVMCLQCSDDFVMFFHTAK